MTFRKVSIMSNDKKTSSDVASLASQVLRDPNASAIAKQMAASALAQRSTTKMTGSEVEHRAGQVLQSEKYSETTKKLAASVVSQSDKKR